MASYQRTAYVQYQDDIVTIELGPRLEQGNMEEFEVSEETDEDMPGLSGANCRICGLKECDGLCYDPDAPKSKNQSEKTCCKCKSCYSCVNGIKGHTCSCAKCPSCDELLCGGTGDYDEEQHCYYCNYCGYPLRGG